jgi:hypothetical protein
METTPLEKAGPLLAGKGRPKGMNKEVNACKTRNSGPPSSNVFISFRILFDLSRLFYGGHFSVSTVASVRGKIETP